MFQLPGQHDRKNGIKIALMPLWCRTMIALNRVDAAQSFPEKQKKN